MGFQQIYISVISTMAALLSASERSFIRTGCRDDCRVDGRTRLEQRQQLIHVSNTTTTTAAAASNTNNESSTNNNNIVLSNGSARLGQSLLCSVRAQVAEPSALEPTKGMIEFYCEQLLSGNNNKNDNDRLEQIEASLSLLLADAVVDRSQLCIYPGVYVWKLHVDIFFFNAQISLDVVSHVVRAALRACHLPHIETCMTKETASAPASVELVVNGDMAAAVSLPGVEHAPVIVTITVLDCPTTTTTNKKNDVVYLVDATPDETECSVARVHVAVAPDGTICGAQASGRLDAHHIPRVVQTAVTAANQHDHFVQCCSEPNATGTDAILSGMFRFC
jgi:exosome complex RNA-binding protein Rrp42 (RNase PH superfamily)